jgi:hypothetical protein
VIVNRRAGAKGKSWRARVLYLKLPLANPEPLLDWLYGKLSFLLRPEVVALMALTIVFAVGLLLVDLDRLSLRSVVSAEGLLLIYLTLSVTNGFSFVFLSNCRRRLGIGPFRRGRAGPGRRMGMAV